MTHGITAVFEPNAAMCDALADTPEEGESMYLFSKARAEMESRAAEAEHA